MQRRDFIRASAAAWALGCCRIGTSAVANRPRPKIAAIFTELRFRSHAFNILENFFAPYLFNGALVAPGVDVVSFYADQFPKDDMARDVSRQLGVPLHPSIEAALCCGGNTLAVDGVLIICEHGDYPTNDRGQKLYPRKEWFDRAVAVMRKANRHVPLFTDKHFSHRFDWAREMLDTARRAGMPLLGGSSVPLSERRPMLELPAGAAIEEAIAIHGGGFEVYDFHAIEILQSMIENRRGGETGVAKVEFLDGEAVRRAARAGRWSTALVDAALAAERAASADRQPRPRLGMRSDQIRDEPDDPARVRHAIIVTYRDGTRGTILAAGLNADRWDFACRVRGETTPQAAAFFNSPWGNRGLFKALSHAAQKLFVEKREPFPAERTLLTTGITAAAVNARHTPGGVLDVPELAIAYQPNDWRAFRERGSTWKIITAATPQPMNFNPGDAKFVTR
jgi:hypothetical protein